MKHTKYGYITNEEAKIDHDLDVWLQRKEAESMRVKTCRKPECHNTIPYDQANPYCTDHASLYHPHSYKTTRWDRHMKYSKYNRYKRDKEANKFYHTKAWSSLSKQLKREAYFTCQCCGHTYDRPGYLITDHIIPRRVDKRRQLDVTNLWVICKRCHYWKGELEDEAYQSASMIDNIDTSKSWDREACQDWILKQEDKRETTTKRQKSK